MDLGASPIPLSDPVGVDVAFLGITLLSAGTDGTDGPTDAAAAVVDGQTIARADARGLSSGVFLSRNDSYTFFENTDELLVTGSTGTNVMDIQVVLLT